MKIISLLLAFACSIEAVEVDGDIEKALKFESVSPSVLSSLHGADIILEGINFDQVIETVEEYDEYGMPNQRYEQLKEDFKVLLVGDLEEISCDNAELIPIDEFFPQQERLRSRYKIQCTVNSEATSSNEYQVVVETSSEEGADMMFMMPGEPLDLPKEDDLAFFDDSSPIVGDPNRIETGLMITVQSDYQSKEDQLAELRSSSSSRKRRSTQRITNILPRNGSPRGGQIITIVGDNLVSDLVNLGSQTDDSLPGHGENYYVYFERVGYQNVPCTINRMFNLLARQLGDHRSIFCETQKVPKRGAWRLKLEIDNGDPIDGGNFNFERVHAPTIDHIFRSASAPAINPEENFRDRSWWSAWSDYDQNSADGGDWEELKYRRHNKNCLAPIAMEVRDKANNQTFLGSADFSGDGIASPERWNLYQGHDSQKIKSFLQTNKDLGRFKCTNAAQTETNDGKPICPDVEVRYLCMDGVVDLQGNIFTTFFDRVESKEDNDANRLQMLPKLTAQDGLHFGECELFLKERDGLTELDLPRVKTSGNYGFIRCLANATEPGLYNLTYNTQDNGNSMEHPRLYSHFANENLTPFNFEVYPQVRSVHPQVGSRQGGTLITIEGSGFVTTFAEPHKQLKVEVGGVECLVKEHSASRIVCQTQMTEQLTSKLTEMDQINIESEFTFLEDGIDCPGNDIDAQTGVWSVEDCITRCTRMADCMAIVWVHALSGKCHYKKAGACDENRRTPHAGYPKLKSAYRDHAAIAEAKQAAVTTTCYYGNGQNYQGDVAVARDGRACIGDAKCRNEDGSRDMPSCEVEDGTIQNCNILKCEKAWANKFQGSRGTLVDFQPRWGNRPYVDKTAEKYSGLYVTDSTFTERGSQYWLAHRDNQDYYVARQRFFFTAPMAGDYRFFVSVDDWFDFTIHREDGTFEILNQDRQWAAIENFKLKPWDQQSPTLTFAKGETAAFSLHYEEANGGDHGVIGYQYLGVDGAGTPFDLRKSENINHELDDRYMSEWQRWHFLSSEQTQQQVIHFAYQTEGVTWDDEPIEEERILPPVFKLEFCNEDGECRTTENLVLHDWDYANQGQREDWLESRIMGGVMNPICQRTFSKDEWEYVAWHDNFESTAYWPGKNWLMTDYGRMCGKKAFRLNQGTHFFYAHGNGPKQSTENERLRIFSADPFKKEVPHVCMALKGHTSFLYAKCQYYKDGARQNKWEWLAHNNDNENWVYESPNGGTEFGYHCFDLKAVVQKWIENKGLNVDLVGQDFSITEMRMWSAAEYRNHEDPVIKENLGTRIVIDEITFGNYGMEPPVLTQTRAPFQFNAGVVKGVSVSIEKNKGGNSNHHQFKLSYTIIDGYCGKVMPVPKVLAPDAQYTDVFGFEETFTEVSAPVTNSVNERPSQWLHEGVEVEDALFAEHGAWVTQVHQTYSGNYLRREDGSKLERPRGASHKWVAMAFNRRMNDNPVEGTLKVMAPANFVSETGTTEISVPFPIGHNELKTEMLNAWPELNRFHWTLKRERNNCDTGYYFDLKVTKYGNFPNFETDLELTAPVSDFNQYSRRFQEGGLYDWLIPGSALSIPRDRPEVVVTVNEMRSGCERRGEDWVGGENCFFDFTTGATPTFVSAGLAGEDEGNSVEVAEDDTLSFEISMDVANFEVTTDNSEIVFFPVDDYTVNELVQCSFVEFNVDQSGNSVTGTCTVGQIAAGRYKLRFTNELTGHSFSDNEFVATYSVDSEDRAEGSSLGGQVVGVTGFGFRPGFTITIFGSRTCVLLDDDSTTYDSAQCITEAVDGSGRKRRNASGTTPNIASITPNKVSVLPGSIVTLSGVNFGATHESNRVRVTSEETGEVVEYEARSWENGELVTFATSMANKGSYAVALFSNDFGLSNSVSFTVALELHSISPRASSIQGGALMTVSGFGFATDELTPSKALNADFRAELFAGRIRCHIKEINADNIVCEAGWGVKETILMSTGGDFDDIEIRVGESVRWEWSFTVDGGAPKIQFQQVADEEAVEAASENDIWSDQINESTSHFTKIFTQKGTYHYTTGFIDNGFSMTVRGKIVVGDAKERAEPLELLIADSFADRDQGQQGYGGVNIVWEHQADHVLSGGRKRRNSCQITTTKTEQGIGGEAPADKVSMIYSWKQTPVLQSLSYAETPSQRPSMEATIDIEGVVVTGDCEDEVIFSVGKLNGPEFIRSHSFEKSDGNSDIDGTYVLNHENTLDVMEDEYWFNFYIAGLGFAYYNNINNDMKVNIQTVIDTVSFADSFSAGTLSTGGNTITIDGEGFTRPGQTTRVDLIQQFGPGRPQACVVQSISYTQIVCELERLIHDDFGAMPIRITFWEKDDTDEWMIQGEQSPGNSIQRNLAAAPVAASSSSTRAQVTFTGTNWAEPVQLSMGDTTLTNCVVSETTGATCDRPELEAGVYYNDGKSGDSYVMFNDKPTTLNQFVDSISVASGSVQGGQSVTASGAGFGAGTRVSIFVNGQPSGAVVYSVSYNQVEFDTPPAAVAGSAVIVITHTHTDDIASFDYEYTNVAVGDISAGALTDLSVGQSVSVTNNGVDCSQLQVEITLRPDECAGACDKDFAICDGGVCTCVEGYYGNGYTCTRATLSRSTNNPRDFETSKAKCVGLSDDNPDRTYVLAMPKTQEDRDGLDEEFSNVGDVFVGLEKREDGRYWWSDNTPAQVTVEGDGPCFSYNVQGKTFASVACSDTFAATICQVSAANRACSGDRLGRDYLGDLDTTVNGNKCLNWADLPDFMNRDDDDNAYEGVLNGNFCRNPNAENNAGCYVDKGDGVPAFEYCSVPFCQAVNRSPPAQFCTIRAANNPVVFIASHEYHSGKKVRHVYRESPYPDAQVFAWNIQYVANGKYNIWREHKNGKRFFWKLDNNSPYGASWSLELTAYDDGRFTSNSHAWELWNLDKQANGNYHIRISQIPLWADPENQYLSGDFFTDGSNEIDFEFIIDCDDGQLHQAPTTSDSQVVSVVDDVTCSASSIDFAVPVLGGGSYDLRVKNKQLGYAGTAVPIIVSTFVNSITPSEIGAGGGNTVTVTGGGLDQDSKVYGCVAVDGNGNCAEAEFDCVFVDASGGTSYSCTFGELPQGVVHVTVEQADPSTGLALFATSSLTVSGAKTPMLTSVSPQKGGTAGGTQLTMSGSNFGSDLSAVTVTVSGVNCPVKSVSDSEIICETDAFRGVQEPRVPVIHIGGGVGLAKTDVVTEEGFESDVTFWYIDRWSSKFTWGCEDKSWDECDFTPKKGDIVVVNKGQVLLLDQSTPLLAVLIIDGGALVWDHQDGIELSAEYVVVTNDGRFEVGTEEKPFCRPDGRGDKMEAYITLYGHQRSIKLPIYGAKVLAVRSGTLDMHGCRITTTWTEMAVSSEIGDSEITLTHPVAGDWFAGDEIVIASTGDIMALHHSEQRTIASVSEDGYTLTLTEPLKYTHISECSSGWGWADTLCWRAEVGLLSRNIKFRGNVHNQWTEDLPECELGIGTAFGTQTCFQNRFGHEVGSDQFGAHILMHRVTHGKIEYAEFTHVGQAFNLGRYPIHFHVPGDVGGKSYVRGNSVYHGFNRAVTLHGVHNLTVEYNVAYNIMGLTFFIEDGIEEDNILQYNLAIMTKKSAALLNVDAIPASFWITNPNNIWRHNHVAGSTHFGYWFNAPEHPTGPSATTEICCRQRPLGEFWNNTVHSSGKYGLWVFIELSPTGPNGDCGEGTPKAMKIGEIPEGQGDETTFGLFSWNNERGAEMTTGGAIQFHNFIATDNAVAGISGKETFLNTYGLLNTMAFIRSIVIGRSMAHAELVDCGDMGIETPWEEFAFTVHDIEFFNFDEPGQYGACFAYDPCYGADAFDCGADTWFTQVKWNNAHRKIRSAWEHEYALRDIDGSFTEQPGEEYYVVPHSPAYSTEYCRAEWPQSGGKDVVTGGHPARLCAYDNGAFKPHRFAFNRAPSAFENLNTQMASVHGIARSPFRICRPLGRGWMYLLDQSQVHDLSWNGMDHVMNVSYSAKAHELTADEYLLVNHIFPQRIDYTNLGNKLESQIDPTDDSLSSLDYYISSEEEYIQAKQYDLTYILTGTEDPVMSESRGVYPSKYEVNSRGEGTHGREQSWSFKVYKCFWENCIKPTTTTAPLTTTTTEPVLDCEDVNDPNCVAVMTEIDPLTGEENTNMFVTDKRKVTIKSVPDGVLKLTRLSVDGELDIMPEEDITIELENLIANTDLQVETRQRRSIEERYMGKIRIGTAENPIPCDRKVTIKLMGNYSEAEDFGALGNSVPVGAKMIGGYGSIEMHGCPRNVYWTNLKETVFAGADTIVVDQEVDWQVGEELAITTSTYEHLETEYVSIVSIDGTSITLNKTLEYRHYGKDDTILDDDGDGWNDQMQLHMASEVALLSRNIVVDGADGAGGVFGGRILVASTIEEDGDKKYHRSGYGQFSNVEFRHMGQFGYQEDLDPRTAMAFYNIPTTVDESTGRLESYIKGCSFWGGFNHAIKTVRTNGLLIENNVIMNMVNTGITLGGVNHVVKNNLVGDLHEKTEHLENMGFPKNFNSQFDGLLIADGIFAESPTTVLEGNVVAGVDGACYKLQGENCRGESTCDSSDPGLDIKNKGHACLRGYFIFRASQGACTKVSGYYFHHIQSDGVYAMTHTKEMIVSNNVVADSAVGVYVLNAQPNAEMKLYDVDKAVTIRHNVFLGRSSAFSCSHDDHSKVKFNGKTGGQRVPNMETHTAILIPDFNSGFNKFPVKPIHKVSVKPPAIYGRTCVSGNTFINYNGKCQHTDTVIRTNPFVLDHAHPVYFKQGNKFVASGRFAPTGSTARMLQTFRPKVSFVNIADCHDMHCDGMKKVLIIDEEGDFLGHKGSFTAESEYKWQGVTRGGHTYTDTRPGLGDYRIPKTLLTRLNGDRIPVDEIAPHKGVIRDDTCTYSSDLLGWVCKEDDGLKHFMMNYQFMDVDHMLRRITPLAVRSDTGYIDLINGPSDHSCCVGYACMIRLNTYWMTMGCNHYYDFHFTGTIPKKMNFHLPDYVNQDCKVHLNFYLAKPYRVDVQADGIYIPPTNARWVNNELEWERPRAELHLPSLTGPNNAQGTNFFDRQAQSIHLILQTGHIYSLTVKATVVLELEVMTELTEDEFYDNGNIANNIAALLGISPSKVKMMNVVRETSEQRRKRREASGLHYMIHTRNARETDDAMTLQLALGTGKDPEQTESAGEADDLSESQADVDEINAHGAALARLSAQEDDPLGNSVKTAVVEQNPEAELEVAKAAVGMAEEIKETVPEWFDPENPTGENGTIMAKLGIEDAAVQNENLDSCEVDNGAEIASDGDNTCDEQAGSVDFAVLASLVAEKTNGEVKLEELETAEEKATREQEAKDAAAEPVEYTTPTRMEIQSVPDKVMVEKFPLSQPVVVVMFDQNDEQMTVVGFASDPDSVTIRLADGEAGTLTGTLSVPFTPGTGIATFDDLVLEGTDNSVAFTVSVSSVYPSVVDVTSEEVTLMATGDHDTCEAALEGGVFDVREIWSNDCSAVCTSSCLELSGLASTAPTCVERADSSCGTFAACGGDGVGCQCDLDSMPDKRQIQVFDHLNLECSNNGFTVTVDKCVMHKFGFTLDHLMLNGLDRDYEGPLATSGKNTCRGKLDYTDGTNYVFKVEGLADCGTEVYSNATHINVKNAIRGETGTNNAMITRKRKVFIDFGCAYPKELQVHSVNIGHVSTNTINIQLGTETLAVQMDMALYQNEQFESQVGSEKQFAVPEPVFVQVTSEPLPGANVVQLNRCWATPNANKDNELFYTLFDNGCVAQADSDTVQVLSSGVGDKANFKFDSFIFSSDAQAEIHLHCVVTVCDPSNGSCTPDCNARKRRDVDDNSGTEFSVAMDVIDYQRLVLG